ncbi:aldo/keto reductase [Nocardioides sp. SLBN-35]|uniref:aldo/keto reductase n=1 Tax=Nocardioides sp. SLBN-35 TaxID=2768445 RepID=UPI00116F9BD5|nr:aldo/keto reductase [Nocardioides sp. SLBN-35]TQK69014.1 aryl-alcohol dehydrogenase-like predicted oxidoreductase [Nocardioides sp. SLBN-35]
MSLPKRRLGDLEISAIGFGSMTLTQTPESDVERGTRAVHAALDAGITFFDTADVYGPTGFDTVGGYGVNERALVAALRSWDGPLDDVVIATKGGHTRDGLTWWIDGGRDHLRAAALASRERLGLDVIPLYQHHRPDPRRPYRESMEALRSLVDDRIVARIGLSNVDGDQIRLAVEVIGDALVSVQNEYSPLARGSEPVIDLCAELGLTFLSWGPFGGMQEAKSLGSSFAPFAEVAEARGVSPQQVALAWQLARSPWIVPIPGASRPESVRDSVQAATLVLTEDELAHLAGGRGQS